MYIDKANKAELSRWEAELAAEYEGLRAEKLNLDLTRGKPSSRQLDLANDMDGILSGGYAAADGTDTRNYGVLESCKLNLPSWPITASPKRRPTWLMSTTLIGSPAGPVPETLLSPVRIGSSVTVSFAVGVAEIMGYKTWGEAPVGGVVGLWPRGEHEANPHKRVSHVRSSTQRRSIAVLSLGVHGGAVCCSPRGWLRIWSTMTWLDGQGIGPISEDVSSSQVRRLSSFQNSRKTVGAMKAARASKFQARARRRTSSRPRSRRRPDDLQQAR